MLTVDNAPGNVMPVENSNPVMEKEIKRPTFSWKGLEFNIPGTDASGMVPLGEIIPVLFLLMTTDSKEERNEIMKASMIELRDANNNRYFPA